MLPHENQPWDSALVKFALHPARACIVHSRADEEQLRALLPKMTIRRGFLPVYNDPSFGEELMREDLHGDLNLPRDQGILLFFGLVRPYKGLAVLIDALCHVTHPVHLLIVGEFWEPIEKYQSQIQKLALANRVTIVNEYVPNEAVASYLATADVLIAPYLSASQSAVIQLALGHELPVIASAVGGIPDAIQEGKTGLLVPPGDPVALAAAIDDFFSSRRAETLRQGAVAHRRQYSWENLGKLIEMVANGEEDE